MNLPFFWFLYYKSTLAVKDARYLHKFLLFILFYVPYISFLLLSLPPFLCIPGSTYQLKKNAIETYLHRR